jgi:hypothetical protein
MDVRPDKTRHLHDLCCRLFRSSPSTSTYHFRYILSHTFNKMQALFYSTPYYRLILPIISAYFIREKKLRRRVFYALLRAPQLFELRSPSQGFEDQGFELYKPFPCKSISRARFKIFFKSQRFFPINKRRIPNDFPGSFAFSIGRLIGIVLFNSQVKICCIASVEFAVLFTLNYINVVFCFHR